MLNPVKVASPANSTTSLTTSPNGGGSTTNRPTTYSAYTANPCRTAIATMFTQLNRRRVAFAMATLPRDRQQSTARLRTPLPSLHVHHGVPGRHGARAEGPARDQILGEAGGVASVGPRSAAHHRRPLAVRSSDTTDPHLFSSWASAPDRSGMWSARTGRRVGCGGEPRGTTVDPVSGAALARDGCGRDGAEEPPLAGLGQNQVADDHQHEHGEKPAGQRREAQGRCERRLRQHRACQDSTDRGEQQRDAGAAAEEGDAPGADREDDEGLGG